MIIYRITNLLSQKSYIGQTTGSLSVCWNDHCFSKRKNNAITSAIKKYGKENFKIEEIAKAETQDQLNKLEKFYIEELHTLAPEGYNLKTGGQINNRYTQQSKDKMRIAKLGTTVPQSTRDKMSATHKQRFMLNPALREERSRQSKQCWQDPEYRNNLLEQRKEYWADLDHRLDAGKRVHNLLQDPEYRRHVSEGVQRAYEHGTLRENLKKAMEKHKRPVVDSDGYTYPSVKEAAAACNTRGSSIIKCIQGKYKSAGGKTWSYCASPSPSPSPSPSSPPSPLPYLPSLYILSGAAGSGKSWVANQLTDKFNYVSYDSVPKKDHLTLLKESKIPSLYDINTGVSTFTRRYGSQLDHHVVVIIEDEDTISKRLRERGGSMTDHLRKRMRRIQKIADQYAEFSGTSLEVLNYLKMI